MRIFNFHLMTDARYKAEKRRSERFGHKTALSKFKDADKIIVGSSHFLKGKVVKEKLVLMADKNLIFDNYFKNVELEIV